MSRIRTIKPEFFLDDELADLPALTRLLFIGLWTEADREGRLEDRPRRLKAALLPYDDCNVDEMLDALARGGFIVRYEVEGVRYIAIRTFSVHQRPHAREVESSIPPPPSMNDDGDPVGAPTPPPPPGKKIREHLGSDEAQPRQCSGIAKGRGKGREGKEREWKDPPPTPSATEGESEPLELLPVETDTDAFTPEKLIADWNAATGGRIAPENVSRERRRAIRTALKRRPDRVWWGKVLAKVAQLKQTPQSGWLTLDWLVAVSKHGPNAERVAEGVFDFRLEGHRRSVEAAPTTAPAAAFVEGSRVGHACPACRLEGIRATVVNGGLVWDFHDCQSASWMREGMVMASAQEEVQHAAG